MNHNFSYETDLKSSFYFRNNKANPVNHSSNNLQYYKTHIGEIIVQRIL